MNDYIKREDATEAVWRILNGMGISQKHNDRLVEEVGAVLDEYPAADVRPVVRGKWEEVEVFDNDPRAFDLIASMRCNKCNRYHNEVYHYGRPTEMAKFCSFCGAKMEES